MVDANLCRQSWQKDWIPPPTWASVVRQCSDRNLLLVYSTPPQTHRGCHPGNRPCAESASFGFGSRPPQPGAVGISAFHSYHQNTNFSQYHTICIINKTSKLVFHAASSYAKIHCPKFFVGVYVVTILHSMAKQLLQKSRHTGDYIIWSSNVHMKETFNFRHYFLTSVLPCKILK